MSAEGAPLDDDARKAVTAGAVAGPCLGKMLSIPVAAPLARAFLS